MNLQSPPPQESLKTAVGGTLQHMGTGVQVKLHLNLERQTITSWLRSGVGTIEHWLPEFVLSFVRTDIYIKMSP